MSLQWNGGFSKEVRGRVGGLCLGLEWNRWKKAIDRMKRTDNKMTLSLLSYDFVEVSKDAVIFQTLSAYEDELQLLCFVGCGRPCLTLLLD